MANIPTPKEIKLHQKEIDYWILTHDDVDSFEFIIMEHLTKLNQNYQIVE